MNTLEDFFTSNREQFNDATPPPGHEQRFVALMQRRKRLQMFRVALSSAAAVIIMVGIASAMMWYHGDLVRNRIGQIVGGISYETIDAEVYYSRLLVQKYHEVQMSAQGIKPEATEDIRRVMQDFEHENRELRTDLNSAQNKGYMVEVMVQSYQTQIAILDAMKATMEQQVVEVGSDSHI